MINEKKYIEQTESLINFYKYKNNNAIKDYILTCHNYISELRKLDAIELLSELEYEKAFNQVLELLEETFRPNIFNSIITGDNLGLLDSEFMIYLLAVKSQLKKPLKCKMLIELQYKYSVLRIQWLSKNGFNSDFESYSIKNIKLTDLWKISIT